MSSAFDKIGSVTAGQSPQPPPVRPLPHPWLFPVAATLLPTATFILVYFVSTVITDHNKTPSVYISDLAALSPESAIFSFLMALSSFLIFISIWLRHVHVLDFCRSSPENNASPERINRIFKWFGWLAALGFLLMSSVPASSLSLPNYSQAVIISSVGLETVDLRVHLAGSMLAHGCGGLYGLSEGIVTYQLQPPVPRVLAHSRFFLSWLGFAAFIVSVVAGTMRYKEVGWDPLPFSISSGQPGYTTHVVSVIAQWVSLYTIILVVATLAYDLWDLRLYFHLPVRRGRTGRSHRINSESQTESSSLDQSLRRFTGDRRRNMSLPIVSDLYPAPN